MDGAGNPLGGCAGHDDASMKSHACASFTFKDGELQSLLASVDQGSWSLADGLVGSASGVPSLQFLPHLPGKGASAQDAPAVFVPSDLSGRSQLQPAVPLDAQLPLPPLHLPLLPTAAAADYDQQQQCAAQQPGRIPVQQRSARNGCGSVGAAASKDCAPVLSGAAKQPHSQVEKQRRDRINSLIDELRELVPPQGSESPSALSAAAEAAAASECRRPKHVVLSDTIRLIKELQLQISGKQLQQQQQHGTRQLGTQQQCHGEGQEQAWTTQQQERQPQQVDGGRGGQALASGLDQMAAGPSLQQQQGKQQQAEGLLPQQGASLDALADAGHASSLVQQGSGGVRHPVLPLAPDDAHLSNSGVVVEAAEGGVRFVKVTCTDRHGLLSDLVRALRELPLEITAAAVTTRRDRVAYDVFQVELEDPALAADSIAAAVEAVLWLPGEKKRRQTLPGT